MSMDGARRELKRLRDKLRAEDRDFRAGAPTVDAHGLPMWDGTSGLSLDAYTRVLDGDIPDAELTEAEADARARLGSFAEVFERLGRDEKAGGAAVTT